jgi:hypothetical protein
LSLNRDANISAFVASPSVTSMRKQQIVAEFGDPPTFSYDEVTSAYSGNLKEAELLCSEVVLPDLRVPVTVPGASQ